MTVDLAAMLTEVLAEHRLDGYECDCGYLFNTTFTEDEVHALWCVHLGEVLAARFAQVGWINTLGSVVGGHVGENDVANFAAQHAWAPVFAVEVKDD